MVYLVEKLTGHLRACRLSIGGVLPGPVHFASAHEVAFAARRCPRTALPWDSPSQHDVPGDVQRPPRARCSAWPAMSEAEAAIQPASGFERRYWCPGCLPVWECCALRTCQLRSPTPLRRAREQEPDMPISTARPRCVALPGHVHLTASQRAAPGAWTCPSIPFSSRSDG